MSGQRMSVEAVLRQQEAEEEVQVAQGRRESAELVAEGVEQRLREAQAAAQTRRETEAARRHAELGPQAEREDELITSEAVVQVQGADGCANHPVRLFAAVVRSQTFPVHIPHCFCVGHARLACRQLEIGPRAMWLILTLPLAF